MKAIEVQMLIAEHNACAHARITEAEGFADSRPELLEQTDQQGIHLVPSASRKSRKDSPPWPATTTTEAPVQLSLFG